MPKQLELIDTFRPKTTDTSYLRRQRVPELHRQDHDAFNPGILAALDRASHPQSEDGSGVRSSRSAARLRLPQSVGLNFLKLFSFIGFDEGSG
jgi:hypothetical protein